MATTTIPWGDGSGDNIYLTYSSASGDQTVEVSSDANTGSARSKVVTFTSGIGNITQQLTVNQEAGEIPGSLISDYVQSGLLLHLDGKEKGNNSGKWTDVKNGYQYTNYGATFNSDHVYFDGVNDYLQGTSPSANATPARNAGTIEIVVDFENKGIASGALFVPRNVSKIAMWMSVNNSLYYAVDNTSARAYNRPIFTLQKASWSVSSARYYENGNLMQLSSDKDYFSGVNSSYVLIGKRNNSSSPAFFKGKVYSIRIYTRQLTQAEVLQNLAVDNLRFNLGLTLE